MKNGGKKKGRRVGEGKVCYPIENATSFHCTSHFLMTISLCVFEPIGNCKADPVRFHMIVRGIEPVAMQLRLTFSHSSMVEGEGC